MLEESLQRLLSLFPMEWERRLRWVAWVGVSLLMIFSLVHVPWVGFYDYQLVHRKVVFSGVALPIDDHARESVRHIPDQHVFGNSDVLSSNVPITSLQLSLVGIMQAVPESQSRVIISEAGQPGKLYRVHDTLPMGVMVSAIEQDGVILENAGHVEKLPLQRHELAFQGEPKQLLPEG